MANLQQRLNKFTKEREEIYEKMEPLKKQLSPLSKRLIQVTKNIETLKYYIKQEKV